MWLGTPENTCQPAPITDLSLKPMFVTVCRRQSQRPLAVQIAYWNWQQPVYLARLMKRTEVEGCSEMSVMILLLKEIGENDFKLWSIFHNYETGSYFARVPTSFSWPKNLHRVMSYLLTVNDGLLQVHPPRAAFLYWQ